MARAGAPKFPRGRAGLAAHAWAGAAGAPVLVCVITLPRDRARCDGCEASFASGGFPAPLRLPGEPRRAGEPLHETITRAHRLVLQDFARLGLHRRWHLLLLEDDARVRPGAGGVLRAALEALEARPGGWTTLHVGHVPLGPCLPVGSHLCHTLLPYGAHAVLYNRRRFPDINPAGRWGRPWFFEGMLGVPLGQRLAVLPSLCHQSVTPKEMQAIPLVRDVGYVNGEAFMMCLSLAETLAVLTVAACLCLRAVSAAHGGRRRRR